MNAPRHFRTLRDLGSDLLPVVQRAGELKGLRGSDQHPTPLRGKTVVVLLEKASTRTRLSFEVGIHELGGFPITMLAKDSQLGRGEPLEDTARMLSGYAHAVVFRTHGHDRIETLAQAGSIPVINGLSDLVHPCQLLADLQTVAESFPDFSNVKVAWIGDGNNMAHSWITAASMLGFELVLACPQGYGPDPEILAKARANHGVSVQVVADPAAAAAGAHVVTTDVWASMGQEDEAKAREAAFRDFCVTEQVFEAAQSSAIFLHCLPAHRGEEVSAEVIDGSRSRVWSEAENRLHGQKALLEWVFADDANG